MCGICEISTLDEDTWHREYQDHDILDCDDLTIIDCSHPYLAYTSYLYIESCSNLLEIKNINEIEDLFIYDCPKLMNITFDSKEFLGLNDFTLDGSQYLNDIDNANDEIHQYLSIMKITKWYKFWKRQKIMWKIAAEANITRQINITQRIF